MAPYRVPPPKLRKWLQLGRDRVGAHRILDVYRVKLADADGRPRGDAFTLECPDWCNVVAITPDDQLVLVWQYRFGSNELSLEIPGGVIDPGESPERAAERELREETGYEAVRLSPLLTVHANPAIQNNRCVTFVAHEARQVSAAHFDPQEEIETVLIPAARVGDLLDSGQIGHSLVQGALEAYWRKRSALAQAREKIPRERQELRSEPPATGERQAHADDAALLHRIYAGAKPLARSLGRVPKRRVQGTSGTASAIRPSAKEDGRTASELAHLRTSGPDQAPFEVVDDGRRVEGRRVDVAAETLRKLRRGRLPIDARLDLHGMTSRDAHAKLESFLRTMRSQGERCVLVIHGKGVHSPVGLGVLRGEIAAWLSQGPAGGHVAAFATAPQEHGGEGAVCILLRR